MADQEIEGLDPEYQEEIRERMGEDGARLSFDPTNVPIDITSPTFHKVGKEVARGIRVGMNELRSQAQAEDLGASTVHNAVSIFLQEIEEGYADSKVGPAVQSENDEIFLKLAKFSLEEAKTQMAGLQNSP